MNNVDWIKDYGALVQAGRDPPQALETLQRNVSDPRPGYDVHHIVERAAAARSGYSDREIDDPSNLVRISRLAHYQISGWYMTKDDRFEGLSPREYLADKGFDERRRVGLGALVRFGVLKP